MYASHRGESLLDRVGGTAQLFGGIDDAVEDYKVVDESIGRDGAIARKDQVTTVPKDDRNGGGAEELAHGVR